MINVNFAIERILEHATMRQEHHRLMDLSRGYNHHHRDATHQTSLASGTIDCPK